VAARKNQRKTRKAMRHLKNLKRGSRERWKEEKPNKRPALKLRSATLEETKSAVSEERILMEETAKLRIRLQVRRGPKTGPGAGEGRTKEGELRERVLFQASFSEKDKESSCVTQMASTTTEKQQPLRIRS